MGTNPSDLSGDGECFTVSLDLSEHAVNYARQENGNGNEVAYTRHETDGGDVLNTSANAACEGSGSSLDYSVTPEGTKDHTVAVVYHRQETGSDLAAGGSSDIYSKEVINGPTAGETHNFHSVFQQSAPDKDISGVSGYQEQAQVLVQVTSPPPTSSSPSPLPPISELHYNCYRKDIPGAPEESTGKSSDLQAVPPDRPMAAER